MRTGVTATQGDPVGRRFHPVAAWCGVVVGPIAWATQLYGGWVLGEVIACAPATESPGRILGMDVAVFTAILDGVLLGATVVSGVLALRELRGLRDEGDASSGRWETWLATAGVLTAGLFTIVILASFVPILLVGRC